MHGAPHPVHVADREDLISILIRHGVAFVNGLDHAADLLRLARSVATVVRHPDGDVNGLTMLTDRVCLLHAAASSGSPPVP